MFQGRLERMTSGKKKRASNEERVLCPVGSEESGEWRASQRRRG